MLANALRQFAEQIRQMLERLLSGEQLQQDELERLAKFVGLHRLDDLRYRDWMAQRMQRALRFTEVSEAVNQLAEMLAELGMDPQRAEQLRQLMAANQRSLEDQLSQYAGQRIADNMSQRTQEESLDGLLNRSFRSLSDAGYGDFAQGSTSPGSHAADARGIAPEKSQDRSAGRQSHHPGKPQAWQRSDADQASPAQPEAQAGRHL